MSSIHFCNICTETIWHQFFKKMSLIDSIDVTYNQQNQSFLIQLKVVPLGPFRTIGKQIEGENYTVWWVRNGNVTVSELTNVYNWTMAESAALGNWTVYLKFSTPQVRSDPTNLLTFSKNFEITPSSPSTPSSEDSKLMMIVLATLVSIFFLVIIGVVVFCVIRRRRRKNYERI